MLDNFNKKLEILSEKLSKRFMKKSSLKYKYFRKQKADTKWMNLIS